MPGFFLLNLFMLLAVAAGDVRAETAADAQRAVQAAWQGRAATAALGEAGRVVVIYGEAPVALVCAPLHICAIEFGPEEEFHDTPSLSDPVRWQMELREGFSSGSRRQYLILKPSEAAEPAILTAFTNRRFYSIRLVPDRSAYTPILSFRFPDDEAEAVRARIEADRRAEAEAAAIAASAVEAVTARTGVPARDGQLVAAAELNFDYLISGEAEFAPQRIYDDGAKTYIELPRSWKGEHPVYHARTEEADRVVNYRIDGRRYEIEGVFEAGALRLGRKEIRIRRRQ